MSTKKRIVKNYEDLPEEIIGQVKLKYPAGFADSLISYVNAKGQYVSALPFETDEIYYLIRMTENEARDIIRDDEDYDDDGILRSDFGEELDQDMADSSVDFGGDDDDDPKPKRKGKSHMIDDDDDEEDDDDDEDDDEEDDDDEK